MAAHAFVFIWINPFKDFLLVKRKKTWRMQRFSTWKYWTGKKKKPTKIMKKHKDILVQLLSFYVLFNSWYNKPHEEFIRKFMNQHIGCLLYTAWLESSHPPLSKTTFKNSQTHTHKKSPLTFLHLNYLFSSVNGNIFYPTGIVKLNSLVPATMLKSLEIECHWCQVLYYHSSIKQTWPYLAKVFDKNNFRGARL